jgi:hypothetical protein
VQCFLILNSLQPFPLQTNSLFGGSVPPSNPVAFGPVGIGNAPRHVNIHIHAGKQTKLYLIYTVAYLLSSSI